MLGISTVRGIVSIPDHKLLQKITAEAERNGKRIALTKVKQEILLLAKVSFEVFDGKGFEDA